MKLSLAHEIRIAAFDGLIDALGDHMGVDALDQRVLEPRLLPVGFQLHEAATVSDGTTRWLKLTYTDGIEPLFFFQKLEQPDGPGAVSRRPGTSFDAPPAETSQITVYQVENVTVTQGRVNGFDVIAMGAVSESGLLDLIESSLP